MCKHRIGKQTSSSIHTVESHVHNHLRKDELWGQSRLPPPQLSLLMRPDWGLFSWQPNLWFPTLWSYFLKHRDDFFQKRHRYQEGFTASNNIPSTLPTAWELFQLKLCIFTHFSTLVLYLPLWTPLDCSSVLLPSGLLGADLWRPFCYLRAYLLCSGVLPTPHVNEAPK